MLEQQSYNEKLSNAKHVNPCYQKFTNPSNLSSFSNQQESFVNQDLFDLDQQTNQKFENIFDKSPKQSKHSFAKTIKKQGSVADRFIPSRKQSKMNILFTPVHNENTNPQQNDKDDQNSFNNILQLYKSKILQLQVLPRPNKDPAHFRNYNLLKFKDPMSQQNQQEYSQKTQEILPFGQSCAQNNENIDQFGQMQHRKILKVPFKVLDAPALQDDYYLNLIDWSHQNLLAVGLSSCVYLWSASSSRVTKLCDLGSNDSVTSVSWSVRSPFLSIGTNNGEVQIWDSVKLKKVNTLKGHSARVGTLSWNSSVLTSGSRDKSILCRDIRTESSYVMKLVGHKQEVCGLKWSFDEQQIASGGNDNKLLVWNLHSTTPVIKFENHLAAVKALAWSPHQHGLLVSGGGTADRSIRFWNTLQSVQTHVIDAGSQVCNLIFSKNVNEFVSTHGYSLNQIIIWNYPEYEKLAVLTGHTYRVLYLAMSPDGQTIVTGAGDETLRFWNVFPGDNQNEESMSQSLLLPKNNCLR